MRARRGAGRGALFVERAASQRQPSSCLWSCTPPDPAHGSPALPLRSKSLIEQRRAAARRIGAHGSHTENTSAARARYDDELSVTG